MTAIISLLVLAVSIFYFFKKLKEKGIKASQVFSIINNQFRSSIDIQKPGTKFSESMFKIRSITIYLTLIVFTIMLISSFLPTGFTGEHLSGLFLVIHVTFAPVFSVLLALALLFYAHNLKMTEPDFKNLEKYRERTLAVDRSIVKIIFWMLSIVSIPLLFSIILILYPIFGTDMQNINVLIHRLSALLFSILAIMLLYFIISSRKNA